jgi:hypothetical protein
MHEYKRLNFKKHPSIATELIKFLAINTSLQAIEKLTAQVARLDGDANKTKKKLAAAEKASSLAGNKAGWPTMNARNVPNLACRTQGAPLFVSHKGISQDFAGLFYFCLLKRILPDCPGRYCLILESLWHACETF